MTPDEVVRQARHATDQGFGLSADIVLALIAAGEQLAAERDTAHALLDTGIRDLARARGVHPDVIRVALGAPLYAPAQGPDLVRPDEKAA